MVSLSRDTAAEQLLGATIGLPAGDRRTLGGYSHVQIDRAGFNLLQSLQAELKKEVEKPESNILGLHWSVAHNNSPRPIEDDLLPARTFMADIAPAVFAKRVVSQLTTDVAAAARETLKKKGY